MKEERYIVLGVVLGLTILFLLGLIALQYNQIEKLQKELSDFIQSSADLYNTCKVIGNITDEQIISKAVSVYISNKLSNNSNRP